MRISMPLFQFDYAGDEFAFSDSRFSLRRFETPLTLDQAEILSDYHKRHIRRAQWAIIADVSETERYKSDVSLLLMSFRLVSTNLSPVIRFRLHEDISNSEVLMELPAFIHVDHRDPEAFDTQKIRSINAVYESLRHADTLSVRIKNALYFLYSGFHSTHWIHAFVFYISALEAFFSKDQPGGATKTICNRTSRFLDDPSVTKDDINHLYNIRSRIVHGDIEAHKSPGNNLCELEAIERIVCQCFQKMVQVNCFCHYATTQQRDSYLSQFDY